MRNVLQEEARKGLRGEKAGSDFNTRMPPESLGVKGCPLCGRTSTSVFGEHPFRDEMRLCIGPMSKSKIFTSVDPLTHWLLTPDKQSERQLHLRAQNGLVLTI